MDILDLGATGAICFVLLLLALIGFFKGFIRMLLGILCLGAAGYSGYWTFGNALELFGIPAAQSATWLPWLISIASGLIIYATSHYLCNFIIDPFNTSKTGRRIGFGVPAALITLSIGIVSIWLLLSAIRFGGSVAELAQFQLSFEGDDRHPPMQVSIKQLSIPILIKAKNMVDTSTGGAWHLRKDPFHTPGKITLCKLLILYHHAPSRIKMLKTPRLATLLNHPTFLGIAHQQDVKSATMSQQVSKLYSSQRVTTALSDKEFLDLVVNLDSSALIIEAS
jgi:uncharacterized membrane protein required for colicin V production